MKQQLKELFLTKQGWIGWAVANILTSLPWAIPLVYAFITNNNSAYIISASIWAFMIAPFTPIWIINVIIAVFVKNILIKKSLNKGIK